MSRSSRSASEPGVMSSSRMGLRTQVGLQVREPARPEEVYVGACGSGAYGDRPEPSFDSAVAGGRESVAAREVADADEHYASGVPSAEIPAEAEVRDE